MGKKMILVSACLAGVACRYDGRDNVSDVVLALVRSGQAIPFCPEIVGGLPTPRVPCEIRDGAVVDQDGVDRTEAFLRGADEGLKLAQLAGCTEAILKSYSPSCGCGMVYDGTFTGKRVPGQGLFAALLKENGIAVRTDEDVDL